MALRIKLKKVKGEWIIYCVGVNLKDDGGNLESPNMDVNDVGLGPIAADKRLRALGNYEEHRISTAVFCDPYRESLCRYGGIRWSATTG